MGITALIVAAITVYEALIILVTVLSWFTSPYSTHPVMEFLRRATDPVLEPARKILPASGGIDLSPLIVLVALELLKRILI